MSASRMSRELERVQNWDRARALLAVEPAGWMETLGARIAEAEPGRVVVELIAGPRHRHGGGVVQGRLRAVGRVIEMRQTLLFSEADVFDEQDRLVARASSTCMPVPEGQGRE